MQLSGVPILSGMATEKRPFPSLQVAKCGKEQPAGPCPPLMKLGEEETPKLPRLAPFSLYGKGKTRSMEMGPGPPYFPPSSRGCWPNPSQPSDFRRRRLRPKLPLRRGRPWALGALAAAQKKNCENGPPGEFRLEFCFFPPERGRQLAKPLEKSEPESQGCLETTCQPFCGNAKRSKC